MVSRSRFQNPFPFRIGTTTDPTTGTAATATIFDVDHFLTVVGKVFFGRVAGFEVLAKSLCGLRELLGHLAAVTTASATLIGDGYDPSYGGAESMLGYRADPTPGLAFRVMGYEYGDLIGDTLLFRLWSPDRLRAATAGTSRSVAEVERPHDAYYYRAAVTKP